MFGHQVNRPLTLVKPRIHSRRRKPKSYYYDVGGQGAAAALAEGSFNISDNGSKPKNMSDKKFDEEALMEIMATPRPAPNVEPPQPEVPNFPNSMPLFPDRE